MKKITTVLLVLISAIAYGQTYQLNYPDIRIGSSPTGKIVLRGSNVQFPFLALGNTTDSVLTIAGGVIKKVPRSQFSGGGSSYTFNNGLTETSGVVGLGGDGVWNYNSQARIGGLGKGTLNVTTTSANLSSPITGGTGAYQVQSTGLFTNISVDSKLKSIEILNNRFTIRDSINNEGMKYAQKYRTNLTPRSVVDKEYVDSVASGGGSSTPDTLIYRTVSNSFNKAQTNTQISNAIAAYTPPSQVDNDLSASTTRAPSKTAVNTELSKFKSYRGVIDSIDVNNLRNDQSAVAELSGNRILVAYSHFKTNPDDPGESAIWAAISNDGGVTHGTPYQLIPKISEGSYIPSFYKKSNGNIVCLFYVLTKNTIPYTSSIYRAEYDSNMNVVTAPTSILSGGYTAPASDRIFKDEVNNRLIYPYAKLVSGTASSTTSVYEGRLLVSSNDGTTWTDNGVSFGSGVVTGSGFGGALEPGIYYDKSKGLVAYFRTLVGSVYASNITYSGGNYTAGTPYSMGIASSNAQVTIKYFPKKDIYLAVNMDVLNNDPLDYTLRKRLTMLTSYDGNVWSQTEQIDRVYGTSALNEPTIYFDNQYDRVNIYYSSSPDGNNFDLRNLIIPYRDIHQQYDNPVLNQNFLYQKANAKIDGKIEILNNTNDNSLVLKRGGLTGKYALIGFDDSNGVNQAYSGLASDGSNEFTTFSKSQIRNQSATNSAIIFGNTQPLTPDYSMGVLGKKVLVSGEFQDPAYFDNASNYKATLTIGGDVSIKSLTTGTTGDSTVVHDAATGKLKLVAPSSGGGTSLSLTTIGTSGAATLNTGVTPNVLNIPTYVATDFYPLETEFEGQGTSADKFRLKAAGVSVAKGGTGVGTLTGIVKGNGTSAFSVATPGTDYVAPSTTVAGFPLSSNVTLASLTATNTSLTFSGTYNGATARTVGVNLGNTFAWTAKHTFATPTTSIASINLPHGVAPTTPVNGDVWTTSAGGVFARINGATQNLLSSIPNLQQVTTAGSTTTTGASFGGTTSIGSITNDARLFFETQSGKNLIGSYNNAGGSATFLSINSFGGNVGIGTATDNGSKLQVSGAVSATGIVSGSSIVASGTVQGSTVVSTGGVNATNDVEVSSSSSGFILKSPNGNRWRITISNTGVLTTTAL